jgi:hypothetical protein
MTDQELKNFGWDSFTRGALAGVAFWPFLFLLGYLV